MVKASLIKNATLCLRGLAQLSEFVGNPRTPVDKIRRLKIAITDVQAAELFGIEELKDPQLRSDHREADLRLIPHIKRVLRFKKPDLSELVITKTRLGWNEVRKVPKPAETTTTLRHRPWGYLEVCMKWR